MNIVETLRAHKIIAIVRGIAPHHADAIAAALHAGGIRMVEITMNTPDALGILRRWRDFFGDALHIGAGTVMNVEMARHAVDAGAQFIIAPHLDEATVRFAAEQKVPMLPGAMTPTEIVRAWEAGAAAVKVFPSGSLGPKYFEELRGPLPQIPLVAVGGVNINNVAEFIQAGAIGAGIGSHLVNREWIETGRYQEIERLAQRLMTAANR
jgi:2-dehydro-3-deoxyphosphogluconate aldolase/(4S)-4-hydroxy-2-oxoglutarate aldolase